MIHVERRGAVALLTIDRPAAKNALDLATLRALTRHVANANAPIVLTGAGDIFVSGGDLNELRTRLSRADAEELTETGHALTTAIAEALFPVVAALSGPAIGGGAELALACDLRIAGPAGRLCFAQVNMAVTTSWGGAARLLALAPGRAAGLLFTGRDVLPDEALAIGLVDEVAAEPVARALAVGEELAARPPGAIAAMKRLVRACGDRHVERAAFVDTWSGDEHRDAVEGYFRRRAERKAP